MCFVIKKYLESKLDVFNLAYIRHSVEIETNSFDYHHHTNHRHSHIKSTRVISSSIITSNNHKWYHSLWKTKTHTKENERRKSSVTSSITSSNGDIFSEDVRYKFIFL